MASSKCCVMLAILSIWVVVDGASNHRNAAAPAPTSVDCTSLVMNMAECLSFVSNGSTTTRPEGTCCSGLKLVLNTNAECLCEMFKSSAKLGVALNITKALTLPAACNIHVSPAVDCGLASTPTTAPAFAPSVPTSTSGNVQSPAPSRKTSGSNGLSIPVGYLVIGFAIAAFSSF